MRATAALILFASILLLTPAALATHDGSPDGLDFVFSADQVSDTNTDRIMYKEEHTGGGLVTVTDCQLWRAENAAQTDIQFPEQTVEYSIATTSGATFDSLDVGVYDPDTDTFTAETGTGSSAPASDTFTASAFTVPEGDHLAVNACFSTPGDVDTSNGQSWIDFRESSEPVYPTPELGSLLLAGVGMVVLIGVARVRRDE